jgi:putative transposase
MSRIARVVVPGIPHHVTQRGNRRQRTFFNDSDYAAYLELMAEWCAIHEVQIWAYCLMPNHVHLIAVPAAEQSLRLAIGKAHRHYTRRVNLREGWTGHLWQGRFASFPMDGQHVLAAARYIELNPVRAGLAAAPQDYRWSSCRAHLVGRDDGLVTAAPLNRIVGDWKTLLSSPGDGDAFKSLRRHEHSGRPLGDETFVARLEKDAQRVLRRLNPGPKPNRR